MNLCQFFRLYPKAKFDNAIKDVICAYQLDLIGDTERHNKQG